MYADAMRLALFHTTFNLIAIMLVVPFLRILVNSLEALFRVE
jgi:Na+/phosphate symporter